MIKITQNNKSIGMKPLSHKKAKNHSKMKRPILTTPQAITKRNKTRIEVSHLDKK